MPDPITELSVSRLIAAPIDRVWAIATERLAEWWCPKPWNVEIVALDWRPGGRSAMVMHGPGGEAMPQEEIILEVVPGRRFVFSDAFAVGWHPRGPFMVGIVELAVEGRATRYTATARHWTAEACAQHREMGFERGWRIVADQLAALAEG